MCVFVWSQWLFVVLVVRVWCIGFLRGLIGVVVSVCVRSCCFRVCRIVCVCLRVGVSCVVPRADVRVVCWVVRRVCRCVVPSVCRSVVPSVVYGV